jgi:hypothetical protein
MPLLEPSHSHIPYSDYLFTEIRVVKIASDSTTKTRERERTRKLPSWVIRESYLTIHEESVTIRCNWHLRNIIYPALGTALVILPAYSEHMNIMTGEGFINYKGKDTLSAVDMEQQTLWSLTVKYDSEFV